MAQQFKLFSILIAVKELRPQGVKIPDKQRRDSSDGVQYLQPCVRSCEAERSGSPALLLRKYFFSKGGRQ